MTYAIKFTKGYGNIYLIHLETDEIIIQVQTIDEANRMCWLNKNPKRRFQVLANSFASKHELTWWDEEDDLLIPNGYETREEARLAIVEDLIELCVNNDYLEHPNPFGDFSIIDTFTGDELEYDLVPEEYFHPNPEYLKMDK